MKTPNVLHTKVLVAMLLLALTPLLAAAPARTARALDFEFPAQVGSFRREGPRTFDPGGNPTAKYSAGRLAVVDVYHYKTYGHTFEREFADCSDYLKLYHADARMLSDAAANIAPGGRKHRGRRAVFSFRKNFRKDIAGPYKSQLLLFQLRDRFVKYRVTYTATHAARAEAELAQFMAALAWPE